MHNNLKFYTILDLEHMRHVHCGDADAYLFVKCIIMNTSDDFKTRKRVG